MPETTDIFWAMELNHSTLPHARPRCRQNSVRALKIHELSSQHWERISLVDGLHLAPGLEVCESCLTLFLALISNQYLQHPAHFATLKSQQKHIVLCLYVSFEFMFIIFIYINSFRHQSVSCDTSNINISKSIFFLIFLFSIIHCS